MDFVTRMEIEDAVKQYKIFDDWLKTAARKIIKTFAENAEDIRLNGWNFYTRNRSGQESEIRLEIQFDVASGDEEHISAVNAFVRSAFNYTHKRTEEDAQGYTFYTFSGTYYLPEKLLLDNEGIEEYVKLKKLRSDYYFVEYHLENADAAIVKAEEHLEKMKKNKLDLIQKKSKLGGQIAIIEGGLNA